MPVVNTTLQRKKSLPDVQNLPRATTQMSREEVSTLGSARREEIRRQIQESERLRANPLLYLISPQVKVRFQFISEIDINNYSIITFKILYYFQVRSYNFQNLFFILFSLFNYLSLKVCILRFPTRLIHVFTITLAILYHHISIKN